jgi:beta-glucosidase
MRTATLVLAAVSLTAAQATQPSSVPQNIDSAAFLQAQFQPLPPLSSADARRIDDLLSQMTPKEKVGQMTQLEIGMVTDGQDATLTINPGKLRKAVVEYGVGSILNVKDTALTLDKWHELIGAIQQAAAGTRLKIPVLYGIDTIHGANYVAGATLFPQPLGMAATWDPELAKATSRIAAEETRAAGIPWTYSPVLDIGRQPLWPRLYETYGEDPHLASVIGAATVRGYQGDNPADPLSVAATLKHYVGYSGPLSGHDRTPALISDGTLREYYLPTFAAGVKAGALSVMVNSGEVNGIPGHVNKHLLIDILRGELGFDGVIDSDWQDIEKLVTAHHTEATEKDATRDAILAGIDMSMVPSDYRFSDLLVQLVNEGAVPTARIDDAVRRILTMKARVGLFASTAVPLPGAIKEIGTAASRQVARRAAQESIVLEKNADGVLPLAAGARVLITGPTADSLPALDNGWTITWQGDRAELYPKDRHTVRGALEARLGDRVTYVPGASFDKEQDVQAAASAAANVDAVVLCLGEMSYAETPGNIDDLSLPPAQMHLADAVMAAGKPVILVMIEGRPRIIAPIADRARAILVALNPGLEGGDALADVLFGDVNPSGRLPITYPRAPNALLTYDHKASEDVDTSYGAKAFNPQFEFGSGLSYTTFEYSGLSAPDQASFDAGFDVTVSVRNTGSRAGSDVVELFISDQVASITPPVKRLRHFVRVDLPAGASRELRFHVSRADLSFVGAAGSVVSESGAFTVRVGSLTRDVTVR